MHRVLLGVLFCSSVVSAQHLFSFGIKGGVPLNSAFPDRTTSSVDVITHTFSSSKNYLIGATGELHLPLGFSVEADLLYHPINLTVDTTTLPNFTTHTPIDTKTVEVPILLKYHFAHTPVIKPYAAGGPIFRAVGSEAPYLSKSGFALGAGLDLKLVLLTLSPELRYVHWGGGSEVTVPVHGVTSFNASQNQAQFLIGLTF